MSAITAAVAPTPGLEEKLHDLNGILRSMGRVLIGYSGGVDSAMLALAAHKVLGANAIAVTADSASYASGELEAASAITEQFGIRHMVVSTAELDNPDYARNPVNRCYFCKQELFTHMQRLAAELDAPYILYGQNADDGFDFRPGAQAARDHGVRAPLQEAGLTKADVRALARRWNLPVWDRPAMACLASRFPYGTPVTAEGLDQVDRAERYLRACGFDQLRVRHHGRGEQFEARIEVPAAEISRFFGGPDLREKVTREFAGIGYARSSVDLRGFRSGSLNEARTAGIPSGEEIGPQIQDCLAALELGPFESAPLGRMITLRLQSRSFESVLERRLQLVEHMEELGFRYVAVDLHPLP